MLKHMLKHLLKYVLKHLLRHLLKQYPKTKTKIKILASVLCVYANIAHTEIVNRSRFQNTEHMPSVHPYFMSAKKTRLAVSKTIDQVNAQREVLIKSAGLVNAHQAILSRPFLGRLRWLFLGK